MQDIFDLDVMEQEMNVEQPATQIAYERDGKIRIVWGAPGITADQLAATLPEGIGWWEVSREEAEQAMKPTAEEEAQSAAAQVRSERDRLLAATDYLLARDYPLTGEAEAAVTAYRQALRDVPQQAGFAQAVEWPARP